MSKTDVELQTWPKSELDIEPSSSYQYASRDKSPATSVLSRKSQGQALGGTQTEVQAPEQHRWNESRSMMFKVFASFWCMVVLGMNDGQLGAIIPYLQPYYGLSYIVTSVIFICPTLGYIAAGLTVNRVHVKLGQRGIALIAPLCKIIGYTIVSQHPPYPAVLVALVITSYGSGLEDSGLNAFIGHLQNANEVLGLLHGCYGLGGVIAPLIATAMITKAGLGWYTFSYVLLGGAVVELLTFPVAFRKADSKAFLAEHAQELSGSTTARMLRNKIVWICAMFLLVYVGVEVSIGGWTVSFMLQVRNTPSFDAGISATAFWLGITVGRVILGFVTGRIGEKLAIQIYLACAIGLHLIFYLVPSIVASFIAVSFEGFFLGPLFPAAIVATTKLLPPSLHVSGVGFAAAVGAAGACLLPFAVGAIAQAKGVQVLMPIVLAFLAVDALIWTMLPGKGLKRAGKSD